MKRITALLTGVASSLGATVAGAAFFSGALSAATVTPLEGPPLSAAQLTFANGQVVGGGKALIALADTDWLELGDKSPVKSTSEPRNPAAGPGLGIWLTDGGWLPATALAVGPNDTIRATTPFGPHDLPLTAILGWGTSETAAAADGLDRVVVASGPLDGRVQGLRAGKLLFASSLDPEPLALELTDIQGLRLAQPLKVASGLGLLVVIDGSRPPLRLRATDTGLQLAINSQPIAAAPAALAGLRLRVDGGRRTWLSDVPPATVKEQGAFDVVWPWQRDRNLDGGPLMLAGVRYAKGLTVHSAATLSWSLNQRFVRLRALVGIADAVAPEGDCPVSLTGDGKVLWQRDRLRGGEVPAIVDLDVRGVTTLTLDIALGERFDIGDHVVLADAYLVQIAK